MKGLHGLRALVLNNDNNNSNANGNNNLNNNARFASNNPSTTRHQKMEHDLYQKLCSYENLELAWRRARRHKTLKPYVIEFEKNLKDNLLLLRAEILFHSYRPKPLETFIIRDPKTRKISKSDFRDRIVHHAVCNIIEPVFDKTFIHDSYANRKGKGVIKALERFDKFKRKVSRNDTKPCFVLKADIKRYFDTVDYEILVQILKQKINDAHIIWLIKIILGNHRTKENGKGMPLGNLTSQFFANAYLNELDRYIKHTLKVKYYIRYVDDFVIMENSREKLEGYKVAINGFLKTIKLELHPDKSKISRIKQGICFLGFRNYYYHKLLKKSNIRKMENKLSKFKEQFGNNKIRYDKIYVSIEGWIAYAHYGNTYKLRKKILKKFEELFPNQIANTEINRWVSILKSVTVHGDKTNL